MSKKQKAFKLFDQGKRPKDQEVKDLGLKAKTTYNYYPEWKKSEGVKGSNGAETEQTEGQHSSLPATIGDNTATVIKFQPHVINSTLTPIMQMGRMVVINE